MPTRSGEKPKQFLKGFEAAFFDTPDGVFANALCLTIVEMKKTYNINWYENQKCLLDHHPSKDMPDKR